MLTMRKSISMSSRRLLPSGALQTIAAALLLAGVGRMVMAAQRDPDAAKVKNPVAATPESVAAGKLIYQRSCATCHGLDGAGGPGNDLIPAAPGLTGDKWEHGSTDGEIFNNIKDGIAPDFNMTPWKDQLKDPDIWNVVNYLRSIAKKKQDPSKTTNSQPPR